MKYSLTVDGIEFKARGVKFKEIKEIVTISKEAVYETLSVFDKEDMLTGGIKVVTKHFDTITQVLTNLTSLTEEEIGELEVLTLVHIIDELLKLNGVDSKKIYDFLKKTYLEKKNQPTIQMFQEVAQ